MKKINFELFDQGLDVLIGNDVISLASYSQLSAQKKSIAFKTLVRDNINISCYAEVDFDNQCSTPDNFVNNLKTTLHWIYENTN